MFRKARLRVLVLESLESRMLLAVPATPTTPILINDTGTFNNDDVTNANNSAVSPSPPNAPEFDVSGIEPGATLVLYRNGQEVSQLDDTAGGTVAIADLNGGSAPGQNPIPSGIYVYRVEQIDQAGNASQFSSGLTVTIDADPPLAPPAPVLDPASDTSHGLDQTTRDNNPILQNPPVFDVADVEVGASVILYRAPIGGGGVGTFSQVNALSDTAGGAVAIADLNNGAGLIPDGSYVYQAREIDVAGNVGPLSADSATITIDTTPPVAPSAPALVEADDTGVSDTDGITAITKGGYPAFEVSGIEGNATVRLFRLGPGSGSPVQVATAIAPASATPLTITIVDLTRPTPDGTYIYTAQQVDQAGNVSLISPGTSVTYDTATPATPSAPVLDSASETGGSNPPTTSVQDPTFDVNVSVSGLELNSSLSLVRDGTIVAQKPYDLTSGMVQITDPGPVSAGTHFYQAFLTDLAGNTSVLSSRTIVVFTPAAPSAPTLDPSSDSGTKGDGITNVTSNLHFNIAVATLGDTVQLYRNGQLVATRNGPGLITDPGPLQPGETCTYTAQQVDPNGTASSLSTALSVTIVTPAAAPDAPVLQSSPLGNDITGARSPVFNVSGVPAGVTLILLRDGKAVNTVAGGAGGTVAVGDPGPLLDGQYAYSASMVDGAGNTSPTSSPVTMSIVSVPGDYTGTGTTDLAVFRRVDAGTLETFIAGGVVPPGGSNAFGSGALDVPFQGDLDGDGKTDLILYRPSTQTWYVQDSSGFQTYQFGGPGDIPVVGDFDGSGHDELGVYRPSTGQWFVAGYAGAYATFGGPDDLPVPLANDYGLGRAALAVYRPSTSQWFIAGQSGGITFGAPGDVPIPLDYYGTGRDVLAVYRPSTSQWLIAGQSVGISFGAPGDIPIVGDFDGIGRDEIGVYRPSTGQWFVGGHGPALATFGGATDIPLEAPYAYRALPGSTGSVISASSVGSLDLSINALSLSTESNSSTASTSSSSSNSASTASPLVAASTATSASTGSTASTGAPAASSSTQSSRPNQAAKSSMGHVHDLALASLQIGRKRIKGRSLLGG